MIQFHVFLMVLAGQILLSRVTSVTCLSLFLHPLSRSCKNNVAVSVVPRRKSLSPTMGQHNYHNFFLHQYIYYGGTHFRSFATSKECKGVDIIKTENNLSDAEREKREAALHKQLAVLGIDSVHLRKAAQIAATSMTGYDPYYGKSAIKAYRTFIYPRPSKVSAVRGEDVEIAASRCARQIDFLAKRNRSHEAEWVRHHDALDDSLEKNRKLFPLVILLDNVRSAFNVGSIFRTADACGCSMVITTGITPSPFGSGREKLAKSALQADRVVPSKHFATTREAINYLRAQHPGFCLIGMETTERSKCYIMEDYPGKGEFTENGELPKSGTVLILGNEVTGVDTEILPLLDKIVEIPMFGTKNSLNIAACAPVVMYEILRKWGAMDDAT